MTTRVAVLGAGPAGRALTHRLVSAGLPVTLVDPRPDRPWRATYACWTDELPHWVGSDVIAAQVDGVVVTAGTRRTIARGYCVLDTAALQQRLTIDGAHLVRGRVGAASRDSVLLTDGATLRADVVIDCRGPRTQGVPRQTAFGVVVDASTAAPFLDGSEAVLMDWRAGFIRAPSLPSFLYTVPLGNGEYLLEETCLAGYPALSVGALRARLADRLGGMPAGVRRTEHVAFGLLGATRRPWRDSPHTFGARGGFMNPTTGYSVAASLAAVDPLTRTVVGGGDPADALWPDRARAVYALRLRGLGVLLRLDETQMTMFFDAFFTLPIEAQRSYLSSRDDLVGTLRAMSRVFATARPGLQIRLTRGTIATPPWSDDVCAAAGFP